MFDFFFFVDSLEIIIFLHPNSKKNFKNFEKENNKKKKKTYQFLFQN